ncbi:MAG: heat-shock protein [Rhodobacteraceae bacterium]|nr:heat-shock protein [Paracoccaceae bacterium]MBR28518.1 heat-shock protein [Paracoccaceae bacterium]
MRNFDFSPLYRSTVGFDRLAGLMDAAMAGETAQPAYPPYNIEKTGESAYRISVAVAGFREQDLTVESRDGQLLIAGKREPQGEGERHFLHRGIAERAFERRFQLADHVRPVAARTENGLLHVDLVREVPEALRPRRIEIATGRPSEATETKAIEGATE